jgi:acid phosphatase
MLRGGRVPAGSIVSVAIALLVALTAHAQPAPRALPRPDHVVIVVEENRAYSHIIGNMAAQYINALANRGALFSQSYGVAHPSQPNYLALFAGSTMGVTDNSCPFTFKTENLASQLIRAGFSFATYSESLPSAGFAGCMSGDYQRKHNPMVNWQGHNVPAPANLPFTAFPADFSRLPTVVLVVPDQQNDMHNGQEPDTIIRADNWLKKNLDAYLRWADKNNSLLIVTFDEDDGSENNRIATIFAGPMVRQGVYAGRIDHYSVLRTLSDMYGLPPPGRSAEAKPVDGVWISPLRR